MILHDVRLYGKQGRYDIHIRGSIIAGIEEAAEGPHGLNSENPLDLGGCLAFPGLINSHDHLDFNLYPQLGNRVYRDYREWGPDIQATRKDIIESVQGVPAPLRVRWGLYKNLLNGFTTVVHHGDKLDTASSPVQVFQESVPLHSPAFEKRWKWKLNNPFTNGRPVVMHIGEGTGEKSSAEISEVIRFNKLKRKIIAVHGVAMDETQLAAFAGLVWCPASNYFLLDSTADITGIRSRTKIVFGTDSTLTSSWNGWEHFRQALSGSRVTERELMDMLTVTPAALWGFKDRGVIRAGCAADIVVTAGRERFFDNNPEDICLVVRQGQVRLCDERFAEPLQGVIHEFSHITMNGKAKWVQGDLPALAGEIRQYYPEANIPFDL